MGIELYLDGKLMETDKCMFPLNKEFQNIFSPTEIISEYSKTVTIPMTRQNNRNLGYIYRIDKVIQAKADVNIGTYLDPTRKIPYTLRCNDDVLMQGYAKFNSAVSRGDKGQYNITLFGTLGEIFQKFKDVVVDKNFLDPDRDEKYVLNDHLTHTPLNLDGVAESWKDYRYLPLNQATNYDIVGITPSYRGYYADFESEKIQKKVAIAVDDSRATAITGIVNSKNVLPAGAPLGSYFFTIDDKHLWEKIASGWKDWGVLEGADNNSPRYFQLIDKLVSLTDILSDRWKKTYKAKHPHSTQEQVDNFVDNLKPEDIVGDGLKDYQIKEYRVNQMKPLVYIHSLFEMFQEITPKISDYTLEFDNAWCNEHNPYWANMAYMFDFFNSGRKENKKSYTILNRQSNVYEEENLLTGRDEMSWTCNIDSLDSDSNLIINKHDIQLRAIFPNEAPTQGETRYLPMKIRAGVVIITMEYKLKNGQPRTAIYWSSPNMEESMDSGSQWWQPGLDGYGCDSDNYIQMDLQGDLFEQTRSRTMPKISIPVTDLGSNIDYKKPLKYTIKMLHGPEGSYYTGLYSKFEPADPQDPDGAEILRYIPIALPIVPRDTDMMVDIPEGVTADTGWRADINISLSAFYKSDKPIFDVLLQYTKMFGLMWVVDDVKKIIKLSTKSSYFKNYTVEDWTRKVDKSKDFMVEPITFDKKYVSFNYDTVDGNNYTQYKKQWKVPYGQKDIVTHYEFNHDTKKLFENMQPSCLSTKYFARWEGLLSWDLVSTIQQPADTLSRIDASDDKDEDSITINNWYLRDGSVAVTGNNLLTVDSIYQQNNKFAWIDPEIAFEQKIGKYINYLPKYSIVIRKDNVYYGCIFNQPNIDFTQEKEITEAGHRFIYDYCWESYLNERYNIQNKRVTCYMLLSPRDWVNFEFNHFIIINSQLFMINKIFDFDPSSTQPTKVELVQITEVSPYVNDVWLRYLTVDTDDITSDDTSWPDPASTTRTFDITVKSHPHVDAKETQFYPSSTGVRIGSVDTFENTQVFHIEIDKGTKYKGYLHLQNDYGYKNVYITYN